jgi:hypothetical protein
VHILRPVSTVRGIINITALTTVEAGVRASALKLAAE